MVRNSRIVVVLTQRLILDAFTFGVCRIRHSVFICHELTSLSKTVMNLASSGPVLDLQKRRGCIRNPSWISMHQLTKASANKYSPTPKTVCVARLFSLACIGLGVRS